MFDTISGTNLAGLSASAISDEYILDVSPPVTGYIEFDDDNQYISEDLIVVKLVGFHDKHSGIDYYSVGIGTSNISADIQKPKQYMSDIIEISLTNCDIRDGHKYYIIVQVNFEQYYILNVTQMISTFFVFSEKNILQKYT